MAEVTKLIHKYLRHDKKFPHVWCPGCGNGIFLGALIRAIDRTGFEKDQIVIVSGIGCSGRISVYVDFNPFPAFPTAFPIFLKESLRESSEGPARRGVAGRKDGKRN